MRHRKSGIKLNRTTSHRNAMFRNMVTSLFKYDRIKTTDAKAKELRRLADNMVTLAKRGDLHARRQAMSVIREKDVVHKLFENANERYGQRNGGYTRIIKLGKRPGDAANVSIIELITGEAIEKKKKAKPKTEKKQPVETTPEVAKTVEEAAAETTAEDEAAEIEAKDAAEEETTETDEETAEAAPETDEAPAEEDAEAAAPAEEEDTKKEE